MTAVSPYLPGKDLPTTTTGAAAATDDPGLLPGPYALRDRIVELQAAVEHVPTQLLLVDVWSTEVLDPAVRTELTAVVASCLRGSDWLAGDGPVRFGVLATGSSSDAEAVAVRVVGAVTAAVPGAQAVAGITGGAPGADGHRGARPRRPRPRPRARRGTRGDRARPHDVLSSS